MQKLSRLLAQSQVELNSSIHPRVTISWQDKNLVYRQVHNPHPELPSSVGKTITEVFGDTAASRHLAEACRQVIQSGQPHQEHGAVQIGSRLHYFDTYIEPVVNDDGSTDGVVTIAVDLTDLMEARDKLREANKRLVRLLDAALGPVSPRD